MRDRHIWPATLGAVAVAAVLLFSAAASATSVSMLKETWAATDITAATGAATRYTGWVNVNRYRSMALEIAFTRSAGTVVSMSCWTATSAATANGSGYDLHILQASATAGTQDSYPLIWKYTTSASKSWTWTVANLPHDYVNCGITVTSGGANDLLTVKSRGITP